MAKKVTDDFEHFYAPDRAQWRAWLEANHQHAAGVWLIYFKKESGKTRVPYDEAVEEALCFGWIDSVPNKIDELSYKQLFSPRKPKSNWSKLNKERVERLLNQGLMHPSGLKKIEIAKQNGAWDALNEVEQLLEPEALAQALDAIPLARQNWDAYSRTNKRVTLEWINNAKRPETRANRIQQTVEQAAQKNIKANFPKQ
ncbi:MAG: YdeI/OmpD-associated family protein [Bacteroidota bacterium]